MLYLSQVYALAIAGMFLLMLALSLFIVAVVMAKRLITWGNTALRAQAQNHDGV